MVLGTATVSSAAPSSPKAEVNQPTALEIADLTALLSKFSVPAEQQATLIQKAKNGQAWDVYDKAKSPVTTENDVVIANFSYTINRFADGSVSAVGLETSKLAAPSAGNSPVLRALRFCTSTGGTGYRSYENCQIDGVWGSVRVGAAGIDYTILQGGRDSITYAGYGFQTCIWPTNCSTPNLVISEMTELGPSTPAAIRWQSDISATWGSWNAWVQLNVGSDSAWQTNS